MIEIKVDDREVRKALRELAMRVENLRPAMREVAGIMWRAVEDNFEMQGRPDWWKPLAPSTIKARTKRRSWPGRILQERGDLVKSVSRRYDAWSATVGTNKVYAAIHQFGGKAGRGRKVTIPARPFLVLTDDDTAEIVDAIRTHIERGR